MIIHKEIDFNNPLTKEQKQMLENLKTFVDEPDEDCPELTSEQLSKMKPASEVDHNHNKQAVTVQLSPQAYDIAKSLGKGYASILSRMLEDALKDKDKIKHYQ